MGHDPDKFNLNVEITPELRRGIKRAAHQEEKSIKDYVIGLIMSDLRRRDVEVQQFIEHKP